MAMSNGFRRQGGKVLVRTLEEAGRSPYKNGEARAANAGKLAEKGFRFRVAAPCSCLPCGFSSSYRK